MVIKCGENESRARLSLGLLILTTILVWVATGCQPGKTPTPIAAVQPPVISEPKVGAPTPLKPGEEAGISVEVSRATGVTLTYTWIVDGGEIVRGQESPAITYRAPDEPGTYNVRVVVEWDDQSVERATSIKVEEEPTPTPTSPPTDTPVPPTDTPVPPTDTPVPTTDTPVSPTDTPVPPTDTPVLPTDTPTSAPADECPFVSPIRIPIEGPSVDAEVSITSMENCADNLPTATSIPLAGTYSGDLTNKEIWILVYPVNLVYYPQSTDACANISTPFANGRWAEMIRLGREGVPEAFHIVAVVTDIGSPASEAFHNYLTVGCSTGNYQGLTLVPPGATELDSITVHTR